MRIESFESDLSLMDRMGVELPQFGDTEMRLAGL